MDDVDPWEQLMRTYDNPAWTAFAVLADPRSPCFTPGVPLDIEAFTQWAAYCEEPVPVSASKADQRGGALRMASTNPTLATWAPALLAALAPDEAHVAQGYEEHLWALHGTLTRLQAQAAPPVAADREVTIRHALAALDPTTHGSRLSYGEVLDHLQAIVDAALFPK